MTKIFLLDDDKSVLSVLRMIIDQKDLGVVCGTAESAEEALDELQYMAPDIVITDLLMPGTDGIAFVRKAKRLLRDTSFIMLSQVMNEKMISRAYEAGVEFFIRKPINSIEVINVVQNVAKKQNLQKTVSSIQNIFDSGSGAVPEQDSFEVERERNEKLQYILQKLGITGEKGCDDIVTVVNFCCQHEESLNDMTLKEIFARFTDSPKSMEQRIRRAATAALSNLAHIGLNDYGDELFSEFAGNLFKYEQVKKEMDYIQGKSDQRGNVQIKRFIAALVNECRN
ncbi:MAG: DNA-binding domain-containing protein [Anaerovoracaceae bacterium]|nr:DNA-binding domain-containing protein [Bacillota bacterium]MDY2670566.1 DNA-binding domain-containing protein [Anaerovoracaceae bacterium]